MDFEEFKSVFAANFRPLTEKDGLSEWKTFSDRVSSPSFLRKVIENLAAQRASQRANGVNLTAAPGLQDLRTAWNLELGVAKRQREQRDFGSYGACNKCLGSHFVKVIAIDDQSSRDGWRPVLPEEIAFQQFHGGFEMAPCPLCCGNRYGDPHLRDEVNRCALPNDACLASIAQRFIGGMQ